MTTMHMYDACLAQLTSWADDSSTQLKANIANSTATWKIVNSHSTHYAEAGMQEWFDIINDTGVHLWLNGHTHGENRRLLSASGIPTYAEGYLQYHTADDKWSYAESFNSTSVGGVATKHCWYVPNDGGEGQECTSSSSSS
ncbi:uncharacterized protein PITG_21484 [Phytophthora infestans T30-4]|uniref:Calcineurin-like phosphoesterase domain-containing protein n=1 Tax=Phytophthora infestans (strain T30-4) TaxID=403677 RepID=D0P3R0_PHYIT|nr:uncharacterized protein PITG_21484 [Phytophthora infestans T30-4]EEY60713.1 conserved hypothetical protein [Phytophthora infestans T30-4]|eukprot:XP_002895067.1 conserved hypothetical protein [Phytophthora infestans T30-4]